MTDRKTRIDAINGLRDMQAEIAARTAELLKDFSDRVERLEAKELERERAQLSKPAKITTRAR